MENRIIFDRRICGGFAILLDTTAGHFDFNFDFNYPDSLRTSKNHQIFIHCLQDGDLLQFFLYESREDLATTAFRLL